MIRVGILVCPFFTWKGGENYLGNLQSLGHFARDPMFEFCWITPKGSEIPSNFSKRIFIPRQLLNPPLKMLRMLLVLFLQRDFILEFYLRGKIDVISHSLVMGRKSKIPSILWLPDFQHIERPYLFSNFERIRRELTYRFKLKAAMGLILSSETMYAVFKQHYIFENPIKICRFRATRIWADHIQKKESSNNSMLVRNPSMIMKYFYYPAQYWVHKNHLELIRAFELYCQAGGRKLLVLSGATHDYRANGHSELIQGTIENSLFRERIVALGVVPYTDVVFLMRNSFAVINVSAYEGWSSTLEEAKALSCNIITTPLEVFKEQNDFNDFIIADGFEAKAIFAAFEKSESFFSDTSENGNKYLSLINEFYNTLSDSYVELSD